MEMILTIFSALIIFLLSQLCLEIFIKPIVSQRKLIETMVVTLTYYSNVYYAGMPVKDEYKFDASTRTRKIATEIRGNYQSIPFYSFFEKIKLVKKKNELIQISRELIGLSNQVLGTDPTRYLTSEGKDRIDKIENLLKVTIRG